MTAPAPLPGVGGPRPGVIRAGLAAGLGPVRAVLAGRGMAAAFAQTMAAQVLVVALNVATGVLTARVIGPEGRGVFTAVTFWPLFISFVAVAGLGNAAVVRLRTEPDRAGGIVAATLSLALLAGLAAGALGALAAPWLMGHRYGPDVVAFAVAATLVVTVLNCLNLVLRPLLIGLDRLGAANAGTWANAGLYLAALLGVWGAWGLTGETAALCQFGAGAVILAWLGRRLFAAVRPSLAGWRGHARALGAFAGRAAPGEVMATIAQNLDKLVLVPLIPAAELGLYAVAFSLSRLMMIIQVAIGSVALPAMAGREPAAAKAVHDGLFRGVLAAVLAVCAGAFLLGDWALSLLYGQAFAGAGPLFRVLVVEAALTCLCTPCVQLFLGLGRPGHVSRIEGAALAVSLGGLVALVPWLGALGAAIAVALSAALRLGLLLRGLSSVLRLGPPSLRPAPGELGRLLGSLRRP